jgi:hypothetical protein
MYNRSTNSNRNYLFHQASLSAYIQDRNQKLEEEVKGLGANVLSSMDDVMLVKNLVEKYELHTPVLLEDQKDIAAHEAEVTVYGNFAFDDGPHTISGIKVTVRIPFKGNEDLFHLRPSTFSNLPEGTIGNQALTIEVETADKDAEKIKNTWQGNLSEIKKYLSWVDKDAIAYNSVLESTIKNLVTRRRKESDSNQSLIDSIKAG